MIRHIQELKEEKGLKSNATSSCLDPFFARDKDELRADMVAGLLLLPYRAVLQYMMEYRDYLKEFHKYPLEAADWIKSLARRAQLSSYHTIIAYQYVKYLVCDFFEPEFEPEKEEHKMIAAELDAQYAEFIRPSRRTAD